MPEKPDNHKQLTLFEAASSANAPALSISELSELTQYESTIEQGLQTFHKVGMALVKIRDQRLYRGHYSSFEEYCKQKWGMRRRHADRIINASNVIENLSILEPQQLPATESQARPLTSLPPELQRKAWQQVLEKAPEGKITATLVQNIIEEIKTHPLILGDNAYLDSNQIEIDNSQLYFAYRKALASGDFQITTDEKWPTADLSSENKIVQAVAQLKPPTLDRNGGLYGKELEAWQDKMSKLVMSMDDLTADVLDIISAQWLKQAKSEDSMATVTADDFLRSRGLQQHKSGKGSRGGYKDIQRHEIAENIEILSSTWITVFKMEVTEEIEGKKGKFKRTEWEGRSRAVVVSSEAGKVKPDQSLDVYTWRLRPGDVFAKFLFGPGRQTALLSQKALEFDPYRQKWEKRLTRFLAWQWRNRQKENHYEKPFFVKTLLKAVNMAIEDKHPNRTKERLEKALDTLEEDQIIAQWQYEKANENIVGQRGWGNKWLHWKIIVKPPQSVIEQYEKILLPLDFKNRLMTPKFDPNILKQTRKKRKTTQKNAAQQIGITQARLSQIERGGNPSTNVYLKIQKWLSDEAISQ